MLPSLPLLAFGFATPAMLAWLAMAAAPLLIHLWSRRRYREMPWAAMEYLLAALRQSRRRMRLEHWLLLAVRTLLVVLIVLAVAEPFFERVGLAIAPGQRVHRLFVLDGSFSMAYMPTEKSRFDRAKELAAEIVDQSPRGDGFTLVLMSDPPRVVVGTPVFDSQDFLQEIEQLTLPHTTADLTATLARIEAVLDRARRDYPRLARHEVYFLTDLGRVGWNVDKAAASQLRQRARKIAESARLIVIDLGQAGAENIAVTGVRTDEPLATTGRAVRITAQLRNFGRQSHRGQVAELLVDGRRIQQQQVSLPAGGAAAVEFAYRFEAPGEHALEVRTAGDSLDVDNHRWLALPVKDAMKVLVIDGRPSARPFEGAAGYLAAALSPGDTTEGPSVEPEVVPESALLESDLSRYDCLFLANVAQFTGSEARVLDSYLRGGGSVVFFLGDQVIAERYNSELAGQGSGRIDILPARLGEVVEKRQTQLDPRDYRHPIVAPFRGQEKAGLLNTPVNKYVRLELTKGSPASVALALGDGSPLIVERPVHRGRVVLIATSADTSWTLMPVWPSYVPIVQEILAFVTRERFEQRSLRVGQSLGASLAAVAGKVSAVLEVPGGGSREIQFRTEGDSSLWSFADTSVSGIYRAKFGPPLSRDEVYAVNVDPRESDLTKLTAEELHRDVWRDVRFSYHTTWENVDQPTVAQIQGSSGSRLAKGLLYAVMTLLFAETYIAWRFGHQSG